MSLTVAVLLTVVTVLLIVAHLDHLAHGLQVGEVVRRISQEGQQVLEATLRATGTERPAAPRTPSAGGTVLTVPAPRDGWVTQAPSDRILAAVPPGTAVRLDTRAGAHLHAGEPLATVWPVASNPRPVLRRLSATVLIADSRTMQYDVDFALRQLVDVGLRALSAAVNDPTTAVEATLRVGSLLRRLLVADPPAEAVAGPGGRRSMTAPLVHTVESRGRTGDQPQRERASGLLHRHPHSDEDAVSSTVTLSPGCAGAGAPPTTGAPHRRGGRRGSPTVRAA